MRKRKKNTVLYIDGENISARKADEIMKVAKRQGKIDSVQVYSRQKDIRTRKWWEEARSREFKDIRLYGGPEKDKVDRKIQKDALKKSEEAKNVDIYIFATSDHGYVPVIEELRELGKRVVVIGNQNAPDVLRDACSEFYEV